MQMKIMSKRNGYGFDGGTEFGWAGQWRLDSDFKRWEFSQCEKKSNIHSLLLNFGQLNTVWNIEKFSLTEKNVVKSTL